MKRWKFNVYKLPQFYQEVMKKENLNCPDFKRKYGLNPYGYLNYGTFPLGKSIDIIFDNMGLQVVGDGIVLRFGEWDKFFKAYAKKHNLSRWNLGKDCGIKYWPYNMSPRLIQDLCDNLGIQLILEEKP